MVALWFTLALEGVLVPAAFLGQKRAVGHTLLHVDGQVRRVSVRGETVGKILKKEGIHTGSRDFVIPTSDGLARKAKRVRVVRVDVRRFSTFQRIPARVKTRTTSRLHVGEMIDLIVGTDGLRRSDEVVLYHDSRLIERRQYSGKVLRTRKDGKVLVGTSTRTRHYMMTRRMQAAKTLTLKATAYHAGPESCAPYDDGYTSMGYKAVYGVVAVDPKMIDLGSKIFVEGYGYAVAADTGPAIKNRRIDLCYNSLEQARDFGNKTVRVYLLK